MNFFRLPLLMGVLWLACAAPVKGYPLASPPVVQEALLARNALTSGTSQYAITSGTSQYAIQAAAADRLSSGNLWFDVAQQDIALSEFRNDLPSANSFDQSLNSTDSPLFAGLTVNGNLSHLTSITFGPTGADLAPDGNLGIAYNGQTLLSDPSVFATATQGVTADAALQPGQQTIAGASDYSTFFDNSTNALNALTAAYANEADRLSFGEQDPVFSAWQSGGYSGVLIDPSAFVPAINDVTQAGFAGLLYGDAANVTFSDTTNLLTALGDQYQTPLTAGTDYLAPNGDGSSLAFSIIYVNSPASPISPFPAIIAYGDIECQGGGFYGDASQLDFSNVPASDPNIVGRLWRDGDTLKISNGP